MQTDRLFSNPHITEVLSPNSLVHDAPKDYQLELNNYSHASTPNGLPAPYSQDHKGEKKKKRTKSVPRPNPHRKFSKEWFNHAYETAVEVGKWPRVAYVLLGLVLIGVWIGVMLTFANEEVKFERNNLEGISARGASRRDVGATLIKGTLRQFDPDRRSLTVMWSLAYLAIDNKTLLDYGTSKLDTFHLNLYRDVKAVPEDRNSTIWNMEGEYRVDNITEIPIAVLGAHPWDSVTTSIDFTQAVAENAWEQPLFGYPFDTWAGQIVFAMTDRDSAQETGLNNSFIVSITDAVLADSTFNWRITASTNDTCSLPGADAGCELHIDFSGKRPALVIFAAMVALIVNWLITAAIFLVTGEAVIMRRVHILKILFVQMIPPLACLLGRYLRNVSHNFLQETDILGVCLTALFALPSVRSILPGAPAFGCIIDLIGIIPNIILISLCTTAIAVSKLRMRRSRVGKAD
ncbi:hypothetical protein M408DRAFT_216300 [Serendipita vermifera MAFF 305830]|uniref:Transmembrane protein n=1 Tax=Serendipita vermifera MAFF 305830 TaxID=933852 RepID=A0A0C3BJM8_SERVB|nr:hypothetical protein M408DRAFT_216300 [Serendipita vermifera MAFF 305830]